jgi:solute carrier family 25 folate transporter 32
MEEGLRGLFRGYSISALCTPMFHTLYFPLYESIKIEFKRRYNWEEGSFALYSLSASIAGMTCNVITNPFWMVRTRMQTEIFRSNCEENFQRRYPTNMFRAMQQIAQEEGVIALY